MKIKIRQINMIYAKAFCEVWRERYRSEECSFIEFNNIMNNKIKRVKIAEEKE